MCGTNTDKNLPNFGLGYYIPKSAPKPKTEEKQRLKETTKQVLKIFKEDIRDHREFISRSLARLQETEALLNELESDLTNDKHVTRDDAQKIHDSITQMSLTGIKDDNDTPCSSSSMLSEDEPLMSSLVRVLSTVSFTYKPKLITNREFVIAALAEGKNIIVTKESRSGLIVGIKNENGKTYFIFKGNDGKYDIIDDYGDSVLERSEEVNNEDNAI